MTSSSPSRYLVGIDLGTTHTVVAYADLRAAAAIHLFAVPQLVAPGAVAARPLLPSLRYHPAAGELAAADTGLPWLFKDPGEVSEVLLGELARQQGARTPGRLVASAKSWLSHAGVDRSAPILPWGAADGIARVSPVAASASTLAYIRAAWNQQFPRQPLERQELVLTVPAS
ncbi:MAG TPA: molecular chaperone DnaK, partial [Candidatus Competibacteraceae bacterium]|nr:molecular chaperone DnaK [Candidatus Competibacteraceae bacterium]